MESMKCQKLVFYKSGESSPVVLLGIVLRDEPLSFTFKTGAGKIYTISKSIQFSLEPTEIEFRDFLGGL